MRHCRIIAVHLSYLGVAMPVASQFSVDRRTMAAQTLSDPRHAKSCFLQPVDQTPLIQGEVVVACSHGRSSSSMLSASETTLVALRDRIYPLAGSHRRIFVMLNKLFI